MLNKNLDSCRDIVFRFLILSIDVIVGWAVVYSLDGFEYKWVCFNSLFIGLNSWYPTVFMWIPECVNVIEKYLLSLYMFSKYSILVGWLFWINTPLAVVLFVIKLPTRYCVLNSSFWFVLANCNMWSLNIVSGLILPVMDITLLFNVRLLYRVNIWYIVILSISVIPMNFLFDFCIMYMLSISSDKIFIDWINYIRM